MTRDAFDRVVESVIADLSKELREVLDDCTVIIDDWADDNVREMLGGIPVEETPYGFYDGTPFWTRDGVPLLPDRILLFRGPLVEDFPDPAELTEQIRITLMHELGHVIGFDEDDLEERGLE